MQRQHIDRFETIAAIFHARALETICARRIADGVQAQAHRPRPDLLLWYTAPPFPTVSTKTRIGSIRV